PTPRSVGAGDLWSSGAITVVDEQHVPVRFGIEGAEGGMHLVRRAVRANGGDLVLVVPIVTAWAARIIEHVPASGRCEEVEGRCPRAQVAIAIGAHIG